MPAWGGPLRTPKNWFFERFYIIKSNWKSSSLFFLFPLASCCRTLPIDILSTIFWSMQEHHLNILSTEFWSMGQIYSMYKFFFFSRSFEPVPYSIYFRMIIHIICLKIKPWNVDQQKGSGKVWDRDRHNETLMPTNTSPRVETLRIGPQWKQQRARDACRRQTQTNDQEHDALRSFQPTEFHSRVWKNSCETGMFFAHPFEMIALPSSWTAFSKN